MNTLLEQLGRRWALRVVWELRRDALSFNELRQRLGVSPSVLATRLRELAELGVVEREGAAASSPGCSMSSIDGRSQARVCSLRERA